MCSSKNDRATTENGISRIGELDFGQIHGTLHVFFVKESYYINILLNTESF